MQIYMQLWCCVNADYKHHQKKPCVTNSFLENVQFTERFCRRASDQGISAVWLLRLLILWNSAVFDNRPLCITKHFNLGTLSCILLQAVVHGPAVTLSSNKLHTNNLIIEMQLREWSCIYKFLQWGFVLFKSIIIASSQMSWCRATLWLVQLNISWNFGLMEVPANTLLNLKFLNWDRNPCITIVWCPINLRITWPRAVQLQRILGIQYRSTASLPRKQYEFASPMPILLPESVP